MQMIRERRLRFSSPRRSRTVDGTSLLQERAQLARVTAIAASLLALISLVNLVTTDATDELRVVTLSWAAATVTFAAVSLILGPRLAAPIGLISCAVMVTAVSIQISLAVSPICVVNSLMLYPPMGCYLAWFYRAVYARATILIAFAFAAVGMVAIGQTELWLSWTSLLCVAALSLEVTVRLRRSSNQRIETDSLTGVLNRAGYHRAVTTALASAHRTGTVLTMVAMDIDDFKRLNDTHGHAAGDETLSSLAGDIRRALGSSESVSRIGGDEFVVLLPGMTAESSRTLIEHLRCAAAVSFSYGIAESTSTDTTDTLLARADAALYRHKRAKPDAEHAGSCRSQPQHPTPLRN